MVERDRLEGQRLGRAGEEVRPGELSGPKVRGGVRVQVRQEHRPLQVWQGRTQLVDNGTAIEPLAAVGVAIDRDQHFGFDLGEAIDQALRPEIRRAAGPDRAQAGTGQEGDDGLRDVRDDGHDPVAPRDAETAQPGRRRRDRLPQLRRAHLPQRVPLRLGQEGRAIRRRGGRTGPRRS